MPRSKQGYTVLMPFDFDQDCVMPDDFMRCGAGGRVEYVPR